MIFYYGLTGFFYFIWSMYTNGPSTIVEMTTPTPWRANFKRVKFEFFFLIILVRPVSVVAHRTGAALHCFWLFSELKWSWVACAWFLLVCHRMLLLFCLTADASWLWLWTVLWVFHAWSHTWVNTWFVLCVSYDVLCFLQGAQYQHLILENGSFGSEFRIVSQPWSTQTISSDQWKYVAYHGFFFFALSYIFCYCTNPSLNG